MPWGGQIKMPSVTTAGAEFLVNQSTTEYQLHPTTVALDNGNFAVFWMDYALLVPGSATNFSNADVRGRIFNADGSPAGNEFTVNTTVAGAQYRPEVTRLTDGNLLVVWQDGVNPGGSASVVRAQELTAAGVAVGPELQLSNPAQAAYYPDITALPGGGFVAVWQAVTSRDVIVQRYDSANAPVGAAVTIAGGSVDPSTRADVTLLAGGKFVVSWNNSTSGINARIFNADGSQYGSDLILAGDATVSIEASRVTALAGGGFVVTALVFDFEDPNNTVTSLGYRMFDASGQVTSEGLLNQQVAQGSRSAYDIAARADGGFIATWTTDAASGDGSGGAIAAQVVRANGNVAGAPVILNTDTAGEQNNPEISVLSNGNFIVSWVGSDVSGSGIKARLISVDNSNTAPVANADSIGDQVLTAIDAALLLDNDSDIDGDTLTVTGVSNARSGSVSLVNGIISFTPAGGYTGPAVFDYTISDGAGGTATATATIIGSRNDVATVRGAGPHAIDVLANDFLVARPQGYSYFASVAQNDGSVRFLGTSGGQRLIYTPLQSIFPDYFNLLVGQSKQVTIFYTVSDPSTGFSDFNAQVDVTLQGWAQFGTTAADTLTGGAAADHLDGGTGAANRLEGGGGDDWYTVRVAGDVIVEAADAGLDTVRTAVVAFELAANVENLFYIGGSPAFTGTGNAANNLISGGFGDDILVGLGGDDVLVGNFGADLLFGGTGNDIYITSGADIVFEDADGGIDTVNAGDSFYLFANIENLNLAQGNVAQFGVGNALDNAISGNDIDNLLLGGGGADTIEGKGGNDSIFGETGDDILNGGNGVDYLVGGDGNDRIDGGAAADALYGQDGNDILTAGTSFDTDILVGGDGNDTLQAASGLGDYDLIDGGAGDDIYYVDTPADLTFEAVGGGTDTIFANIVGAGYYLYANTENLVLEGITPFGVGNELANELTGNSIGNYLLGGAGNDSLNGKAGNDVLFGESGADSFFFERGTGGDVIGDFQAGVDKIRLVGLGFTSFAQVQAAMVENGGTTAINLGQGDIVVLNGVTNAQLSAVDFIFG
jgi:Ca2+-binding RTX toxin-like protein